MKILLIMEKCNYLFNIIMTTWVPPIFFCITKSLILKYITFDLLYKYSRWKKKKLKYRSNGKESC